LNRCPNAAFTQLSRSHQHSSAMFCLMNAHHKQAFFGELTSNFGSSITKSFVAFEINDGDKNFFEKQGSPRFSLRV
jgi:hypothetical protein